MSVREGEEIQTKSTDNLFNRIIVENFPNLEKETVTQVQQTTGDPINKIKKEIPPVTS
jgi:hypothetical protein